MNSTRMTLAVAVAILSTIASNASAVLVVNPLFETDIVALYPLMDGPDGSAVTGADDIIDDPTHGATDATPNGGPNNDQWIFDLTRNQVVLDTTDNTSYLAGTQDIDLNDGFAWSLWVNVASSNIADPGADGIIGTRSTPSGQTWHKIDIGGGPFSGVTQWAGISGNLYTLADDTWHHLALVGDLANGVSFYIDGNLIGTDATTAATTYTGPLEFGGVSRFGERVTGRYSEIGIWERALTENEIQALARGVPLVVDSDSAIPEPATATIALIGLGGLMMRRRRVA